MTTPPFADCFPHSWSAEILPTRPMILPRRHYVYPAVVEEVERGALEILVRPAESNPATSNSHFLATCALGFRDPAAPTGLWSCPNPDWLCALSGGYAYLIDTRQPERFTMLRYRPVLQVLCATPNDPQAGGLLLFAGHRSILAWGRDGEVWESEPLSSEGLTELRIEKNGGPGLLHGKGWDLRTDRDIPFVLDLESGKR